MDRNIKIALGCFGVAIFSAGTIVGSIINEKINRKYNNSTAECQNMVMKTLRDEYLKVLKENEELKQK